MEVAFFDCHQFEREFFDRANRDFGHSITYFEPRLTHQTVKLASGYASVCCFVNDRLARETLKVLVEQGCRLIALRAAGTNNVDLDAAAGFGIQVARVAAYSPHAVAEHAVALLLCLNRKLHKAYGRVRDLNFSLNGLVGFDLYQKTVGVIGTGKIGSVFATIMAGFGCRVLLHDRVGDPVLGADPRLHYTALEEIYRESDIVSLHVPLTPETHHLINRTSIEKMKTGVTLINTGRGALIDTKALIDALKKGKVGAAGLDVYEEEENVFFLDLSSLVLQDDVLTRLLTFPNVVITSHQAFLTREALENIARTTLENIADFENGRPLRKAVLPPPHA